MVTVEKIARLIPVAWSRRPWIAIVAALCSGCVIPHEQFWHGPGESGTATLAPRCGELSDKPGERVKTAAGSARRDPAVEKIAVPEATGPPPPSVPPAGEVYPIDLSAALRLAEVENPRIAEARSAIGEAMALQQGAMALMLPTLNLGTNYHGHTGNLQRSSGRILSLSEQSLYIGGGARSLAAESVGIPAVNIIAPLGDAIYEPLAARQRVDIARFNAAATANEVLLEVADLYLELLGAEAALNAQRRSEAESRELAALTATYARVGQAKLSDAHRAKSEDELRRVAIQRAEEDVAVASTRLVRRLHLDATVRIHPTTGPLAPISLVDLSADPETLVRAALTRRPELGAAGSVVGVAQTRLRQEVVRPLVPLVWLGFSGAGFGGGSNLVQPLLGNFGGRTDFDIRAYWTLQNLGLGNLALQRRRRSEVGQADAARAQALNEVRREVIDAYALCLARRVQVTVATQELRSAEEGYREDLERTRGAVGLPIEATNSQKLLAQSRQNLIRAMTQLNQSQFALFVALGSPPPLGPEPSPPQVPAPLAGPPVSPLAAGAAP